MGKTAGVRKLFQQRGFTQNIFIIVAACSENPAGTAGRKTPEELNKTGNSII